MLDTIQQAVKQHDQYQIEIKLDYELFDAKQTRYDIDTYIFVPRTLGVTAESYSKKQFYRDVQNYVRLKTPALNLRGLSNSEHSPLPKIERWLTSPRWVADGDLHKRLVAQLKLFSAILKSTVRDHLHLVQERIAQVEALEHGDTHSIIHNLIDEFLTETERLTTHFRALFVHINLPNIPEAVAIAYTLTDESVSVLIEENAIELYQIADAYLGKEERKDYKKALSERVEAENEHRKARGYESILAIGDENETYLYRASVLKGYASSVLFLATDVQRDGWQWEQVAYALAAGLAMIFATLVAFFFQSQFGNFTFPFFVALVVGYMFKDRIKEIGRSLLKKRLQEYFYDRRTTINTRDGAHTLGYLREKMRFIDEKDVPASVLRTRNADNISAISNDGRGENIICYSKEITLDNATFADIFPDFPPITSINDIFRFDIRNFLSKMAEPLQVRQTLHNGKLHSLYCHKVYHVNMISRYKSTQPHTGKLRRHLRLVLNQYGIRRVEEVETI